MASPPPRLHRVRPTYPVARAAARRAAQELANALFAPRTRLGIVDWVERDVVLPPSSPVQGPFRFDYTPYLREPLTMSTSPTFTKGVILKAGQVGYSIGFLCNVIGYAAVNAPESIALMLPTEGEAESFSKDKIRNLLDFTPSVRAAFGVSRSRETDNTILEKRTRAGTILRLLGSNSTSRTRSFTAPILLFDEIDEYEHDEDQGDIISLLLRAQLQYSLGRAKIILGSTPTTWLDDPSGHEETREERGRGSRIFREYLDGDRREWWCCCPSCGDQFVPDFFRHVKWPKDGTPMERAAAAYYCCPHGCVIPRTEQRRLVGNVDAWRPSSAQGLYPSWDIQGLLSFAPGMQIDVLALQFLAAGRDPAKLKPFYNLKLGRVFKETRSPIVVQSLRDRREKYNAEVPMGVGMLTCAVDVQRGKGGGALARLEVLIVGWGAGEESWRIHHYRLFGDVTRLTSQPNTEPTPWERLDAIVQQHYVHESGVGLRISRTVIDSADGEMTDIVYRYAKARAAWGVVPIRGEKDFAGIEVPKRNGRPELVRAGKASDSGVRLILMDTYGLKDRMFGRLRLVGQGPGVMHFPLLPDDALEFPKDYYDQFRNESKVPRRKNKHSIETIDVYEKTGDNESIDLEVQSLGALYDWGADNVAQLTQVVARVQAQGRYLATHQPESMSPGRVLARPASREISKGFHRPR